MTATPAGRSLRAEIGAGLWLQSRELAHLARRRGVVIAALVAYAAMTVIVVAGGLVAHVQHRHLTLAPVLTPAWLLWAVLPAVGAGGGNLDAASSLAPYPVSPRTQVAATWFSALTDVQYLLLVPPVLATTAAATGGWGLLVAVAFVAGASALGQLAGWVSVAGVRAGRGQGLAVTAMAVIALGLWAALRGAHRPLGTIPPVGWFEHAVLAGRRGDIAALTGWWCLLASPVLLLAVAGSAAVRRATVARLAGPVWSSRRSGLRATPAAALAASAWRSVVRTLAWRATLLAVVSVPFLTALLSQHLGYRSLAAVALVSAGATIGANAWAFEAGGVVVLLCAPLSRRTLLLVRGAVLAAALAVALALATVAAGAAGQVHADVGDLGYVLCALIVVTAAGLRTSSAAPSPSDVDSLRARPATLGAVLAFGARCLAGLGVLSAAWRYGVPGALCALAVAVLYAAWALRGARRRLDDGAAVLAAFATTR